MPSANLSFTPVWRKHFLVVLCTLFWECLVFSGAAVLSAAPLFNPEKYLWLQQNDQGPGAFPGRPGPLDGASADRAAEAEHISSAVQQGGGAGESALRLATLERTGRRDRPDIIIQYPVLGRADIDRDIQAWAERIALTFENDFSQPGPAFFSGPQEEYNVAWLNATCRVYRASAECVSIVFDVWMHTGSSQLSQDLLTLTYNLLSGQRLHIVDIFENVDTALRILSRESRKVLMQGAGVLMSKEIEDGTFPLPENFSSIALTPAGILVCFQPYQVSRMPDAREVEVPLDALMPAGPLLALWGRAS